MIHGQYYGPISRLVAAIAFAIAFGPGCIQNSTPPNANVGGETTRSSALGSSGSTTGSGLGGSGSSSTQETQCLIFQNNTTDYSTCLACKGTLCSCVTPGLCTSTELAACTANGDALAQCVHTNVVSRGGSCVGLVCGSGQVADFTTCLCRDATPPTAPIAAPGQDDQLTPYLQPGFFVSSRFCPPPDIGTFQGQSTDRLECLQTDAGSGTNAAANYVVGMAGYKGSPPRHVSEPPANVLQDVGYVRWDLALDASQYSPGLPLINRLPFKGTFSTFPVTLSVFYQLKPNTTIFQPVALGNNIEWNDCAEHFSGYTDNGIIISTNNKCERVAASAEKATLKVPYPLSNPGGLYGTALSPNISANGGAANANITALPQSIGSPPILPGNPNLQVSSVTNSLGLAKADTGIGEATTGGVGTGLFSNIGFYKYTWGSLTVKQKNIPVPQTSAADVTGRIAINMNMGYSPASAVESTAQSPDAVSNTLPSRDCSVSTNPHPCVVTAVYRGAGGSILSQSLSPRYSTTNNSTSVQTLPSGIVAVSTPKIIQDLSQDSATTTLPARLRVFAKANDGNMYMSRYQNGQWYPWMSLGRPWVCNSSIAGGCMTYANAPNVPAVYKPVSADMIAAGNPPGAITGSKNDGLSVVGEPVVASYMNTDPAQVNVFGAIAVFVRVSQLNSSDSTIGPYHNAIFYTIARASRPTSAGTPLEFDEPRTWSQWLPVIDVNNAIVHIQGNPTVLFRGDTALMGSRGTNPFLTLFGTSIEPAAFVGTTAANRLHPPIPYKATTAKTGFSPAAGDGTIFPWDPTTPNAPFIRPMWFNYGNRVLATAIQLDNLYPSGAVPWDYRGTILTPVLTAGMKWTAVVDSPIQAAGRAAIVSDLTYAPLDPGAGNLRDFLSVRILFKQLRSMSTVRPLNSSAATAKSVSPAFYDTLNDVYKDPAPIATQYSPAGVASGANLSPVIGFMNMALSPTGVTTACVQSFYDVASTFVGTPNAVTLAIRSDNSVPNAQKADPSHSLRMLIFGRAYCMNKGQCDPVNPEVAYLAVPHTNTCNTAAEQTVYYAGGSATRNGGAIAQFGTTSLVQPAYATSDVIPLFSRSLDVEVNDVPTYLFFRNSAGNITTGQWGAKNNGTGVQSFQLFPTGGFTN